VKNKFAAVVCNSEQVEEFGTEDDAQGANVKQEVRAGHNPLRSAEAEGATGNHAVEMVVRSQGLIPGMENGQKSDLAVQMRAAKLRKGFRNSFEKNGNERFRIYQKQGVQFVRNGEDQMEVSGWKQFLFAPLNPAVGGSGSAFRAVPVPARVEAGMFGATAITPLHMPAEGFGAAGLDRMHDFQMDGGHLAVLPVALAMKTKNVGKL
jgi:hypothetical protein